MDIELTRVPCMGELVTLGGDGPRYLIQAVEHIAYNAGGDMAHIFGVMVDETAILEHYDHQKD